MGGWLHRVSLLAAFCVVVAVAGAEGDELVHQTGADQPLPGPVPARVLKVLDGDTIRVRARIWLGQEVETNVRLFGVDTAEKRGHCQAERDLAQKAHDFIERKLADASIALTDVNYDKYGRRVVARVLTADGEDLAKALLAANLARPYGGGRKTGWCGEQAGEFE